MRNVIAVLLRAVAFVVALTGAMAWIAGSSLAQSGDSVAVAIDTTTAPGDSTRAPHTLAPRARDWPAPVVIPPAPFAVIGHEPYLLRHTLSFDQWLDRLGGYFLTRQGPLGRDAALSRWGLGRGRAVVTLDGVEINDPQSGVAPLAHIPVSGLEQVRVDSDDGSALVNPAPIEGWIGLEEFAGPEDRARVFLELSNGDRSLRQRRARFSSVRSLIGIDLGYDELLNEGYWFDASGRVPFVQGFGSAETRHLSARLRGEFETGERWSLGFRRYVGDSRSDLSGGASAHRRNGHLATARAALGRVDLNIFERGFDFSDPDSQTVNSTRAVYATIRAVTVRGASLTLKGGFEDIVSEQRVGRVLSTNGIRKIATSAEGGARLGDRTVLRVVGSWAGYWRRDGGWGLSADLRHTRGDHAVVTSLRRTFRLPSLGELFLPVHARDGLTLVGDRNVGDEQAVEAAARLESRVHGFSNDLRASTIRVTDAIAFRPSGAHPSDWRVASNGDAASLVVLEERAGYRSVAGALHFVLDGSATWAVGDREGFFATVPEVRVAASARLGFELFENTSAVYVNVDGVTSSTRRDAFGAELPSWKVVNAMVSARLVDAHLYFGFLNALGEAYRTEGDYLMTPRSMVYGIYWTLFD